jgi:subtilisin family serine protease
MTGSQSAKGNRSDIAGLVLGSLAFLWIWLTSLGIHGVTWFVEQTLIVIGIYFPRWVWVAVSTGHILLLLVPIAPLSLFWRGERARAVFRTWSSSLLYVVCLLPGQMAHYNEEQPAALLRIAGTLAYLGLTWLRIRRRERHLPAPSGPYAPALVLSAAFALPWLAWGALGSPADAVLDLASVLLFGLAAGLTVAHRLLPALATKDAVTGWQLFLAGGGCSGGLAIMASALGFNGMQLFLIPAAGSLGWLAVLLARRREAHPLPQWLCIALLLGLSVAGPVLFVDPDELALVLNLETRDILTWALYAALGSLGVAVAGTLVVALLGRRLRAFSARPLACGAAAFAWLFAALLYLVLGQPGFHGDRLFVILSEQADLSSVAQIEDPVQRRQHVYEALVAQANAAQAPLRRTLDQVGVRYTSYYLVNALEVRAGPAVGSWLRSRPDVGRVLHNPVLRPLPAPPPVSRGAAASPGDVLWNLEAIGAPRVWHELGVDGAGIVVGQSDSGAQWDHPELVAAYRGGPDDHGYNWLDPWDGTTVPTDRNGHGTHTLATAVGQNVGVARGAEWYACVNLARNIGSPARYLECMQFMLAPHPPGGDALVDGVPARGANVINNSWGCPELEGCDAATFAEAVHALRAAGVFVVAAAGNEGDRCATVSSPLALYDAVLSVGAIDAAGRLAPFSSRGPVRADGSGRVKPDLVAPGVQVLSAYPGDTYYVADGTSMAAPHVTGVVALIWSANPGLIGDIDRTEQILAETARSYDAAQHGTPRCGERGADPTNAVGYGIVDAYAAVQRAMEVTER